jgi:hypothetical protein
MHSARDVTRDATGASAAAVHHAYMVAEIYRAYEEASMCPLPL